jgi:hypothetical protein
MPALSHSNYAALETLNAKQNIVIGFDVEDYPISKDIRVCSFREISEILPAETMNSFLQYLQIIPLCYLSAAPFRCDYVIKSRRWKKLKQTLRRFPVKARVSGFREEQFFS